MQNTVTSQSTSTSPLEVRFQSRATGRVQTVRFDLGDAKENALKALEHAHKYNAKVLP